MSVMKHGRIITEKAGSENNLGNKSQSFLSVESIIIIVKCSEMSCVQKSILFAFSNMHKPEFEVLALKFLWFLSEEKFPCLVWKYCSGQ